MPILVPEDVAATYTGRPPSTIRWWAHQGLITRHGSGRGKVRYDLLELRSEWEDDDGVRHPGAAPEGPQQPLAA
jgi:hypothetical protein